MHPDPRPRSRSAGTLIPAVLATLVLLLVPACGGGGSEESLPPVEEQLGLETDGILARQATAENLLRDCMKAQGFEYVPVDPEAQQASLVGQSGMSEDDFIRQFGYGITTLYEQRQAVALGPNEKIRAALPEAQRADYDRTLFGDDPTATFAVAVDTGDFSRLGGCVRRATEEVFGGVNVFQSLQAELDDLDARIVADARMVDAGRAWSQCMRDAGYDLASSDQVDSVLLAKLEAIVGPPASTTVGDWSPAPDYDRAALAALQREEVEMVGADVRCEQQHVSAVEETVRTEYERTFREEHADLLSKVPPP